MQRCLLAPAALGALVLLVSGCGDDDDVIDSSIPDAARSDAEVIIDGGTRAPRADFAVSGCQGISMADGGVAGQCLVTAPRADIESAAELESTVHELSDELEFRVQGAQWTVRAVTALPGSVVEALAGAGELSEVRIGLAPSV